MEAELAVAQIGRVIELAIAPVFLLSGIGALLSVLVNRLGRVIDRARVVESVMSSSGIGGGPAGAPRELATLARRARLIYRAIALCVLTAVLVCAVIVALFAGAFLGADFSVLVALLFIGSMLAFLGGLLTLMRELLLAIASLNLGG